MAGIETENRGNCATLCHGYFDLECGVLRVSDPCYELDVTCAGILRAKTGRWRGVILSHEFLKEIVIVYESESPSMDILTGWPDPEPFKVGVDSGRYGFFDAGQYEECREQALEAFPDGGAIPGGVFSHTGFGDGTYVCRAKRINGLVVAAKLGL